MVEEAHDDVRKQVQDSTHAKDEIVSLSLGPVRVPHVREVDHRHDLQQQKDERGVATDLGVDGQSLVGQEKTAHEKLVLERRI